MALPTVFAAIVSFSLLLLIFRKDLREPLQASELEINIRNKPALIVGVVGMGVCTALLVISSYVGLEMWIVCLASAGAVMLGAVICLLAKGSPCTRSKRRRCVCRGTWCPFCSPCSWWCWGS